MIYFSQFFDKKLKELNAERAQQGLDVLRESNGAAVTFSLGAYYNGN